MDEDSSSGFLLGNSASRKDESLNECHVLVIEDSAVQFELVARDLRKADGVDFRPVRADCLSEGLQRLDAGGIDVVLLDLNLPDSRGLDTFLTLRAGAPGVPVIVLTGIDDEEFAIRAARGGAQDYLVKGQFDPHTLLRSIRYAITRHSARAKLKSALQRAQASEANLRSVITSTVDGIVVVDKTGTIQFANPSAVALFGLAADQLLHTPFGFPVTDAKSSEVQILSAGGEQVPVEMRVVEMSWEGQPAHLAILRDLRLQRQAAAECLRAQQAQEKLDERQVQLEVAQAIQQRFLPEGPPTLPGFDIAGALYPAELAAGDCYDYLPMPDGSTAIAIGDVSGHGFGPALLMAATSAHLRSFVQVREDVAEILGLLNRALAAKTDIEYFVTFLLARLDCERRSLVYANAGHPAGYVLDASGKVKAHLESKGHPLAIDPDAEFPCGDPVSLDPGDTTVLLTDGFVEARSPEGDFFGREGVLGVIRANQSKPASEIIESLHVAVHEHIGGGVHGDDLTAVVIKVD